MVRVHEGALVKAFRNNKLRKAFLFALEAEKSLRYPGATFRQRVTSLAVTSCYHQRMKKPHRPRGPMGFKVHICESLYNDRPPALCPPMGFKLHRVHLKTPPG